MAENPTRNPSSGSTESLHHDLFYTNGNGSDHKTDTEVLAEEIIHDIEEPSEEEIISQESDPIPREPAEEHAPVTVHLSENALTVLNRRYLKKDEKGQVIETPDELFRRVAHFIASADALHHNHPDVQTTEDTFYRMMANLEFLPNSPTLMNAGRELGQLSACFVLPVEDSMQSIFDAVKYTALIHKSGGGTGFSFSRIRPKNDIVKTTRGVASGPISFMHVFDEATETVKQGGTRRGANMAILRVDHPDIIDFIDAKEQDDKLNNFNISVAVTDAFWTALENDTDYDLINPHDKRDAGKLNAREVFDKIVNHAWNNGDPGVVFIDRINQKNPTPHLGEIESTNPCGEQPLLPYESCNLGSINLAQMVKTGRIGIEIDYDKLLHTVRNAVHFLDNVIDMNKYPLPSIDEMTRSTRKIGLGIMGFADLLIQLKIPYNSEKAIETAKQLMKFIDDAAKRKSQELAAERGPFPAFERSVYGENGEPPIRNATRTTIAPTGTISIIAGCSSGIEPLFALAFTRHVMDDDKLPEMHPLFESVLKEEGLHTEALIKKVAEKGHIGDMKEFPEEMRKTFVTSHEVTPEWHIRMQAVFQEHTDNAVSKTVNFPNNATVEDVENVYRMAHNLGCKGVTIYRDGSRTVQVLNKGTAKKDDKESQPPVETIGQHRPRTLTGFTTKLNTGQGSLYVTVNKDDKNRAMEVFANIGKSGGDTAALSEAIGRLISIALKKGVPVQELADTLIGITGSRPVWNDGALVKSVPDGIGQILMNEYKNQSNSEAAGTIQVSHEIPQTIKADKPEEQIAVGPECPECCEPLVQESGCSYCRSCGYSHCA